MAHGTHVTSQHAGRLSGHFLRLLQQGVIDTATHAVAHVLLWRFRRPGRPDATATVATIARYTNLGATKIKQALGQLRDLGILMVRNNRIVRPWAYNAARVCSRWAANSYYFLTAITVVAERPTRVRDSDPSLFSATDVPEKPVKSLAQIAADRKATLDERWRARKGGV